MAAQAAARQGARAARFAALGAAWSGESLITPPPQPRVAPQPSLGAAAVAAAVRLAAAGDLARAREFVARGILAAQRGWHLSGAKHVKSTPYGGFMPVFFR